MSKVTGSGNITKLNGDVTGTYTTTDNSLTYKDHDGTTKEWNFDEENQAYYRGSSWDSATARAYFECILKDVDKTCRRWEWREIDRGTSSTWPTKPTAKGYANRTGT